MITPSTSTPFAAVTTSSSSVCKLPSSSSPLLHTHRHRPNTRLLSVTAMSTGTPESPDPKRVVVCGGGVIGACTAYFLSTTASSPSTHVTLVEKSSIACAASGKAGGFLALDWCDGGPLSSLARSSFELHRSLAGDLAGAESYGYRPLHTLSVSISAGDKGKRGGSASAASRVLPEWVDGPARQVRTIGTVETTAQVHPQLFTRRLVAAAVESGGVEVVIGEVERVEVDGDRATGVFVRNGEEGGRTDFLAADAVVLALGPWSNRSPTVSSLFRVSGLKARSIVLRPRHPDAITPHALFLSYLPSRGGYKSLDPEVYPRPTGEVYVCGMSKETEVPDDPEQIFGESESISMLHEIAGTVSNHFVAKGRDKDAEVIAEQACFLPCTNDGLPVIGEIPGIRGCYVGTGHSCWGILNGPATGKALAELILDGRTTTVDLTPFSPARFLGCK